MILTREQINIMNSYSGQIGLKITGIEAKDNYILICSGDRLENQHYPCYDMYFWNDGKSLIRHFVGGMLYDAYTFGDKM